MARGGREANCVVDQPVDSLDSPAAVFGGAVLGRPWAVGLLMDGPMRKFTRNVRTLEKPGWYRVVPRDVIEIGQTLVKVLRVRPEERRHSVLHGDTVLHRRPLSRRTFIVRRYMTSLAVVNLNGMRFCSGSLGYGSRPIGDAVLLG